MDWKAEALARVRRARRSAVTLHDEIDGLQLDLRRLERYTEDVMLTDTTNVLKCIIDDLFKLEGRFSLP